MMCYDLDKGGHLIENTFDLLLTIKQLYITIKKTNRCSGGYKNGKRR